jgi:hypothetical protein
MVFFLLLCKTETSKFDVENIGMRNAIFIFEIDVNQCFDFFIKNLKNDILIFKCNWQT